MATTIRSLFEELRRRLQRKYSGEQARRWAAFLIEERLRVDRAAHLLRPDQPVPDEKRAAMLQDADRLLEGHPLQYVLGWWAFRGLRMRVTPAVLIPRPETEWLVEGLLRMAEQKMPKTVWDVGTGSGCIAISLKKAWPETAVWAFEVSTAALAVARENAAIHDVSVEWVEGDFLRPATRENVPAPEVIISNPPYLAADDEVAPVVRNHEPPGALFAGTDPLVFYRAIADVARQKTPRWVALEVNPRFRSRVRALFPDYRVVVPTMGGHPYLLYLEKGSIHCR